MIVQIVRGFVEVGSPTPARLMMGLVLSAGILAVGLGLAAQGEEADANGIGVRRTTCLPSAQVWLPMARRADLPVLGFRRLDKLACSRQAERPDIDERLSSRSPLSSSYMAYDALAAWRLDLSAPYSAAPQAAIVPQSYFAANANLKLACVGDWAFAVQPYFNQNICANYYGGAPKPSYYDWKLGQPYPDSPDAQYVAKLMRTGQFDALLVSEHSVAQRQNLRLLPVWTGYCLVRSFEGKMIWKDYFSLPDDLIVFEKCATSLPGAQ